MPNVYTRGGDKGETSLFGGARTPKDDIRVEAYGTMDEANSAIGMAKSLICDEEIKQILQHLQERIFMLGAELASDDKGRSMLENVVCQDDIDYMEKTLDRYLAIVGKQKDFVIPGKDPASSALHIARTVVRRGERRIVAYAGEAEIRPELVKFVNRLSDLLFVFARCEEQNALVKEVTKLVLERCQEVEGEEAVSEDRGECLLTLAKRMAAAARVQAAKLEVPIVFAVTDGGGNLVYFERMADSLLASLDIAIDKAYTAVSLRLPTDKVGELAKEDGPLFSLQTTNDGRFVAFGGGFPIVVSGQVIGGVGVSGGSADEDMAIAQAGLDIIK